MYSVQVICKQATVFCANRYQTVVYLFLRPVILCMSSLRNYTSIYHLQTVNTMYFYRRLEVEKLRMIVRHVIQFITIRQFPPADKSLPPLSKSRWWIPTGTKTLALISGYFCHHVTVTVSRKNNMKIILMLCCTMSIV